MTKQKSEADRRMSVVEAEDQLLDAYRRKAAADLGPGATETDIERAAEDAYWNDAPGQARALTPEELARYEAEIDAEGQRYLEWLERNPE